MIVPSTSFREVLSNIVETFLQAHEWTQQTSASRATSGALLAHEGSPLTKNRCDAVI